jgi:4-azaleucine resistance transporter AzlC
MNITAENNPVTETLNGAKQGIPIFIGYFTTSIAFGLLALSAGLTPFQAIIFSITNLTGAAQFMAINLVAAGALAGEIVISVILLNLRYVIMSASLAGKIGFRNIYDRFIIAFGITDEVFSVASMKPGGAGKYFMFGLQGISWIGWASGTAAGVTIGSFLSRSLQDAMSGALFALFAALLVPEIKKEIKALIIAFAAGGVNSLLYYRYNMSAGWSIVIAMLAITAAAAFIFKDEADDDTKHAGMEIS